MAKYYKLGKNQGIFWDPTQPKVENKKLVGDQIKCLDDTTSVADAKRHERILIVSDKEAKEYCEENGLTFETEKARAESEEDLSKKESPKKNVKK